MHHYQHAKKQLNSWIQSWDTADWDKGNTYLKIIEATFSFPEFAASCKKSAYSNSSFLRYILHWPDWPHQFLAIPTPKKINKNFLFKLVSTCKKIRLFQWSVLEISQLLLTMSILAHISETRHRLPNIDFVQKQTK